MISEMISFFQKRHLRDLAPRLVSDLAPLIKNAKKLVSICQIDENPRALVEAGIAELFVVHKSVFVSAPDENSREAILPALHEKFMSDFALLASEAGLSEDGLVDLIARRLQTYDSLMDRSLPDWHLRLAEQVFEGITSKRAETAVCYAIGIIVLTVANETTAFVRKVLK